MNVLKQTSANRRIFRASARSVLAFFVTGANSPLLSPRVKWLIRNHIHRRNERSAY